METLGLGRDAVEPGARLDGREGGSSKRAGGDEKHDRGADDMALSSPMWRAVNGPISVRRAGVDAGRAGLIRHLADIGGRLFARIGLRGRARNSLIPQAV